MANRNTKFYRKLAQQKRETPKGTAQGYKVDTGKGKPCDTSKARAEWGHKPWQGHPAVSAANKARQEKREAQRLHVIGRRFQAIYEMALRAAA